MTRIVLAAMLFALAPGAASATSQDPIAARKDLFKAFAAAGREPGRMLRGEAAFDLAKVQEQLKLLAEGSVRLKDLFPESSRSGDTKALPAVWEKKADFDALFTKMAADATAAQAAIKDEASFKAEMPKVLGNCGTCHTTYRGR